MRLRILTLLILPVLFLVIPSSVFADSKSKIGAHLSEYNKPNRSACDIRIPSQYLSIQAGIDAAEIGDRVCVDRGTYKEDIYINKSITLSGRGAKNEKTIISGQNSNSAGTILIDSNNVIVEGFKINGVGTTVSVGTVRITEARSNVVVRFNHIIAGAGGLALLTDGFQEDNLINHNILEGNNSPIIAKVNGQPSTSKPSNKVDFLNNTFNGSLVVDGDDTGVALIQHASNSVMNFNNFSVTGAVDELVQNAYGSGSKLNFNNFKSGVALWKVSNGVDILNAENNWWGDLDPSDDVRNNMVDYEPFVVIPFKEYKIK
jgi:hypothetical protein